MSKKLRVAIVIALSVVLSFVIVLIVANFMVKNKVANFLENRLPNTITQTHEDLILDTFEGTITIVNSSLSIKNAGDEQVHTQMTSEKFIIEDVSYWDYLFNDEIHIEDIKVKSANITYYPEKFVRKVDSTNPRGILNLYKPLRIDELSIDNATLRLFDSSKDSLLVYSENTTIEIDDIFVNKEIITRRLPVEFGDYEAEADSVFIKASLHEHLTTGPFKLKDKKASVKDIRFFTKYPIAQYDRLLPKERDHFVVFTENVSLTGIDFGFTNREFFTYCDLFEITQPNAKIYRNKLLPDDPTIKRLYSKMLRELNFNLKIKELKVSNGELEYSEKVKQENPPGIINFQNLNATISNIDTRPSNDVQTRILISSTFMESAPLAIDWSFNINNTSDYFLFKTELGQLPAAKLNAFAQPNLGVRLEGTTQQTYATIDGNSNTSTVEMRMKYDDFKVSILNDEKKKKTILSAIANLFISKESSDETDGFREGSGSVQPDKTKSFFNYLWLNMRKGLMSVLTGDGEKD